jgi:peptide/nickel transport system ATP-binding protein
MWTVQRTILDQIAASTTETGTAVVLITHNLAMAAKRADRILVMYQGECVEQGEARQIIDAPQHEYTKRLLAADPSLAIVSDRLELAMDDSDVVLEARSLRKEFGGRGGAFVAVDDVSFQLRRGRTLAIVGESGSGKSMIASMVLGWRRRRVGRSSWIARISPRCGGARRSWRFVAGSSRCSRTRSRRWIRG